MKTPRNMVLVGWQRMITKIELSAFNRERAAWRMGPLSPYWMPTIYGNKDLAEKDGRGDDKTYLNDVRPVFTPKVKP